MFLQEHSSAFVVAFSRLLAGISNRIWKGASPPGS